MHDLTSPILLIGFMGSGKTTIGKKLATLLEYSWLDADVRLVEASGSESIKWLFQHKGERFFRSLEAGHFDTLSRTPKSVISLGGGIVENPFAKNTWRRIAATKISVIYLQTSFEVIENRLRHDTQRPLFADRDKARELYTRRTAAYETLASDVICTDQFAAEDIAAELAKKIAASTK